MNPFPAERITSLNPAPIHPDGDFVLYGMIAFRRAHWNFSLQRAVDRACELGRPLLILEALRCDYPWASDRFHTFILEGMQNNKPGAWRIPVVKAGGGHGQRPHARCPCWGRSRRGRPAINSFRQAAP